LGDVALAEDDRLGAIQYYEKALEARLSKKDRERVSQKLKSLQDEA
jgi:predicted negative regulator of RcsB-dependent stress response